MSSASVFSFGPQRFTGNSGRNLFGDALGVVRYPNPIFDIAHTHMPSDMKSLFKYCRFYFLTNPLINSVVFKMAEYPITDTLIQETDIELKKRWDEFLHDTLEIKLTQTEFGLDLNCYGIACASLHFPFRKHLICKSCGHATPVERQKYRFRNFEFHGTCKKCGHQGVFKVKDQYVKSAKGIRVIRWNPEQISIRHNHTTGESTYYYRLPATLVADIQLGKRHIIERTADVFIRAAKKNKSVVFNPGMLYVMRRPNISRSEAGWGLPMMLPVLKDTYFLNILRKAQEAIALEHIVPMRVFFPAVSTGSSDPFTTINLEEWQDSVHREIMRFRLDNNYNPVFPIPMGTQTVGGDGRALLLSQEYRVQAEWIVAGMHVPVEFVFGGVQYSGSNVSLRQLEKHFDHVRADHMKFLNNFVIRRVADFMGWPAVKAKFRDFKLADDLQREAFRLQLNQAGKISDEGLLEGSDFDARAEKERIAAEAAQSAELQRRQALMQAAIQAQGSNVLARAQMRLQREAEAAQGQMAGQPMMAPGNAMQSPDSMGNQALMASQQATAMGEFAPPPQPGGEQQMSSPLGVNQRIGIDPNEQPEAVGMSLDLRSLADKIAAHLDQQDQAQRQLELEQLSKQNPQLYMLVSEALRARAGAHANAEAMPAPEQRTPRRGSEQRM